MLKRLLIFIVLCFFGCKTLPPPIPNTQHDSTRVHYDVLYDSIWVDRWHVVKEQGDTIWIHDSIFIEKWREKHTSDTICVRDSVPYPVEVTKEVRVRNGYDKFTARGFWIYTAIILAALIFLVVRWYMKRRFPP